ncbi:MAG: hypothetical protein IJX58_06285 [Clostridia bacterium]|nr:hypothetical protein [Clostridia bacterium]
MNWLCENCSTYNPGENKVCFVCDSKRPTGAIRKAKRAAKVETLNRLKPKIYKAVTIGGKVLFLGSIIVFSIVALISLFLTMSDGLINNVVWRAISIVRNALANVGSIIRVNCREILTCIMDSPIKYVAENAKGIIFQFISLLKQSAFGLLSELLSECFSKLKGIWDNLGVVKENAVEAASIGISAALMLIAIVSEKINAIIKVVSHLIQKVSEQVSQFII